MKKKVQEQPVIELKVTTAEEWTKKASEVILLTLPSGVTVKAKRLKLLDVAITGYLPFELISSTMLVAKKLNSVEDWNSISQENMNGVLLMIDKITLRSIIEPCISDKQGEENSMFVGDISVVDKLFIFTNVIDSRGMEILKPFRGKRPVRSDAG